MRRSDYLSTFLAKMIDDRDAECRAFFGVSTCAGFVKQDEVFFQIVEPPKPPAPAPVAAKPP